MRVHDELGEKTGSAAFNVLEDPFDGDFDDGQEARPGVDLRWVGAVALAGGVETVNGAANMLPLRYFHTIGEDFYSQWVIGNFLSIGIQFRWGRIVC